MLLNTMIMKRTLLLSIFVAVATLLVSCEALLPKSMRPVTQGDIVGTWDYVSPTSGWSYGTITIDRYGNFTLLIKGCATHPFTEQECYTSTGTIKIASSIATVKYDGNAEKNFSDKIIASWKHADRWYIGFEGDANGGFGDIGFGRDWDTSLASIGAAWQ